MDPEERMRMEALCRAFEDLCHELRFHQKECVRTSNAGKRSSPRLAHSNRLP